MAEIKNVRDLKNGCICIFAEKYRSQYLQEQIGILKTSWRSYSRTGESLPRPASKKVIVWKNGSFLQINFF